MNDIEVKIKLDYKEMLNSLKIIEDGLYRLHSAFFEASRTLVKMIDKMEKIEDEEQG